MGLAKFAGMSVWVTKIHQNALNGLPHFLPSTETFVKHIGWKGVPSGHRMVRIDMEHFFMTGSSRELASLASRVLPAGPMRDLVEECIQFL